jgi:hypothetical protein
MTAPVLLRIRFQSESYTLELRLTTTVSSLKTLVSKRHNLYPVPRLIFKGAVLPSNSTLALCGVSSGSLIVVVPSKLESTLQIITALCPSFDIPVVLTSSVLNLRIALGARVSLPPDQITLVHSGRVMLDGYCLGDYDIGDRSTVRVVRVRRLLFSRPRPSQLAQELRKAISRYGSAKPSHQRRLALEISQLLNNPALLSYARFDQVARLVVDDARLLLQVAEHPVSYHLNGAVATMEDQTITVFEATVPGFRVLWDAASRECAKRAGALSASVSKKPEPEPSISEDPLPIWWSTCDPVKERFTKMDFGPEWYSPMKERFSREVRVLKKMGFADESVILMALEETCGNIQRAVKLLMRTI